MKKNQEVNYTALMQIFSRPRPSGSLAEQETLQKILAWLNANSIPFRTEDFTLFPYFFICIGIWLMLTHSLLALSTWLQWGWPTAIFAALGVSGGLLDVALDLHIVTWPGKMTGKNILIEAGPQTAKRELVISAHYDSKTELFDHHTRLFFVKNLRLGILLAVVLGIMAPFDSWLILSGSSLAVPVYFLSVVLTFPLLFLAWGLGLNLAAGRFLRKPSQGAVDNGAACTILLGLASSMRSSIIQLRNTRLTLALFGGEEVNMQGSRTYVMRREWPLPTAAINLEVMAQDGEYVFWEQDGTSLKLVPTAAVINEQLSAIINQLTGSPAHPAGPINSDGYSFLRCGIPATTLGTYDRRLKDRGFHSIHDNLQRVQMNRLPEAVEILTEFIRGFDLSPSFLDNRIALPHHQN